MWQTAKTFADQVSAQAFISDLFYILASLATFLVVVSIALIDGGLVSPKHLIDTLAQKLLSALIAGVSFLIGGYGIWMWQFNQAFDVPHPLQQALSDWWLFGRYMTIYAQNIDPAAVQGAEVQQIFVVFFFAYAAVFGAFIHSMGLGRMKPGASYILSAITGGLIMPILAYLTWSPASPLSNNGLHDFVGAYSLYMFVGVWSLIITWRLGPRIASTNGFNPHMFALGAMVLMMAIPLFVLGCGFLEPGVGYFGISNTSSGLGIIFCNIFTAYGGGALSGAVIAYRKHKPIYMFFGPIAGYVSCTALFDIAAPWECLLVSLVSPWLMHLLKELMIKMNLDDQKLVPLALGPSILSVLMAGVIGNGLPTGGVQGATGAYAFQHAHISFGMQLLGVLVVLLISGLSGLFLVLVLEKTIGIRVPRTIEQDGMDMWYWNEWRKSRKMRVSPKAMGDYVGPNPDDAKMAARAAAR
jgi:ammonium transporter, Amt family